MKDLAESSLVGRAGGLGDLAASCVVMLLIVLRRFYGLAQAWLAIKRLTSKGLRDFHTPKAMRRSFLAMMFRACLEAQPLARNAA
ncbi:hypothetical protein A9973_25405 [Achromobacter sp. UMC46]|nr:hypothetical protein [Achromobacter sp. UMC46]